MQQKKLNKIFRSGWPVCVFCCALVLFMAPYSFGKVGVGRKGVIQNDKGRELILNCRFNEAISSYAQMVKKVEKKAENSPLNNTLIAEYAYALALNGIYDAALANLDRIHASLKEQPDVNFYTAQVFALMNDDDVASEFWNLSDNNPMPGWLAMNASQLVEKYKRKPSPRKKISSEELKAKFKRANELAAYHSYFQSIALFHEIINEVPNDYLPYAGYSIPLEKIGAFDRSAKVIEKAISLVGKQPKDAEKRQFLEHRLEAINAKKAEPAKVSRREVLKNKREADQPQMMGYCGLALGPSLTSVNIRYGYYLADHYNVSVNFGTVTTPAGTTENIGFGVYASQHAFVLGVGLQYYSGSTVQADISMGLSMKHGKKKTLASNLFLDISSGFASGSPVTFTLSYGTSVYFGKRNTK